MDPAAGRHDRRLVRLAVLHLVAWSLSVAWRMLEATPRTSTSAGGTFASSSAGRALAMGSVFVGVAALVAILVTTFRLRRRVAVWVLVVAMAASLGRRGAPDAFDVAYLVLIPAITAWILSSHGRRTTYA